MKTLVIDNYDSFTYNLVHLITELNQEEPMVVLHDEIEWSELPHDDFDNIVISPGPGRPDRVCDFGLSRKAIEEATVPLLGICLGHQGIATFSGGSVVQAPVPVHGQTSLIYHAGTGIFAGIPSPFEAARYHSLMVDRPLSPALVETAWTADGLIMGFHHIKRPQWGVQFHPESIITEYGRTLMQNFRDFTHRADKKSSFISPAQYGTPPPTAIRPGSLRASVPTSPTRKAFWREIPHVFDAEVAFVSLFASSQTAFWLDSSLIGSSGSRWSYLGDATGPNAELLQYDSHARRIDIENSSGVRSETGSIFDYLEERSATVPQTPPPCPFLGGYVGWLGYELRREFIVPTQRCATTPDALFIHADRFIAIDHLENRCYLVAIDKASEVTRAERWIEETVGCLEEMAPLSPAKASSPVNEPIQFVLDRDKATYLSDIEQCLEWIRQGESYEICLTNEISCHANAEPLAIYRAMRQINPAPFAAFLKWAGGAVLSASPERFLAVDRAGNVETKPIKGTIRRDNDPLRDSILAEQLHRSEKDRAENVMIVDLMRNDLSRVCEPGSVVVPTLTAIETYATVHQLVSTVRGVLRSGQTVIGLVRATFPGGSMTGAPKVRTLELIDRLEQRPRGIYSGAIGWIGDDGAADLSIVIRTVVAAKGKLSIGVGGAVVVNSTAEGEFNEMLLKAEASVQSIVSAITGNFGEHMFRIAGIHSPPHEECVAASQIPRTVP